MSTFNTCRYSYYLRYISHQKGIGNCFSSYGLLAHSLFERYAKGELKLEVLADVYEWEFNLAVPEKFPSMKYCKDMRQLYYDQGLNFFKNFEGFGDRKILAVEKEFEFPVDNWIFNGVIDLIYETQDGQLILEDHKSKGSFKSKKERFEYTRQLYLYSIHAEKEFGRYPDTLRFNQFRKNTSADTPFDIGDMNEALTWAKETVAATRICWDYLPTRDEFFCNCLCNHRNTCPYKTQKGCRN